MRFAGDGFFLAFGFLFGPFFQQFFWDYDASFHNKMFNANITYLVTWYGLSLEISLNIYIFP